MTSRRQQVDDAIKNKRFQYACSLKHDQNNGYLTTTHEAQRQACLYQAAQIADDAYGEGNWWVVRASETESQQPWGIDGPLYGDDPVSLYIVLIERMEGEL